MQIAIGNKYWYFENLMKNTLKRFFQIINFFSDSPKARDFQIILNIFRNREISMNSVHSIKMGYKIVITLFSFVISYAIVIIQISNSMPGK